MNYLLALATAMALTTAAPASLIISIQEESISNERPFHALNGGGVHALCQGEGDLCHDFRNLKCCDGFHCSGKGDGPEGLDNALRPKHKFW